MNLAARWIVDAMGAIRSYVIGLRASSRLGSTLKLRRKNRPLEALQTARDGLVLLRAPGVRRDQPAEGSVLVGLTTNAEQLARELDQVGPTEEDLRYSYTYLVRLGSSGKRSVEELRDQWLPYLQKRLGIESDTTDR